MLDFREYFNNHDTILIEGALGVRLRGEYSLEPNPFVANASFIYEEKARHAIKEIYEQYMTIADRYHLPIMLTTPTRRANKLNISKSSYGSEILRDNIAFLKSIREEYQKKGIKRDEVEGKPDNTDTSNVFVGALMGCRGDAYKATKSLSEDQAYEFHSWQANLLAKEKAEFLMAGIMPELPEMIGMARAMEKTGAPYLISFMLRENGRLIDGTSVHDAISAVEEAVEMKPITYMANCIHHNNLGKALAQTFNQTDLVKQKFAGIQANASPLSPEELDGSSIPISSEPIELAEYMIALGKQHHFKIYGGCCGTNQYHMEELAKRLTVRKDVVYG